MAIMDNLAIQRHIICNNLTFTASNYIIDIFERAKQNNEIENYTFDFYSEKNKYHISIYTKYINEKSITAYAFDMYIKLSDTDSNKIDCKIEFCNITSEFTLNIKNSDKVNNNKVIKEIDTVIKQLELIQLKAYSYGNKRFKRNGNY
jgi:hypothetical protein